MTGETWRRALFRLPIVTVQGTICLTLLLSVFASSQPVLKKTKVSLPSANGQAMSFETPEKAADVLVDAADKFRCTGTRRHIRSRWRRHRI